jgi:hypothetical protein
LPRYAGDALISALEDGSRAQNALLERDMTTASSVADPVRGGDMGKGFDGAFARSLDEDRDFGGRIKKWYELSQNFAVPGQEQV